MGNRWRGRAACCVALLLIGAACKSNAPQYRADRAGTSDFKDSDIEIEDVGHLEARWRFKQSDADCYAPSETRPWGSFATPVVWGKVVYQAYDSGCLLALDSASGQVNWRRDFGYEPPKTCTSNPGQGLIATPTISEEQNGDTKVRVVYVNAPDGYLYKVDAATGTDVWENGAEVAVPREDANDYYAWSSPLVLPDLGLVVVGMSSNCDFPFGRGGLRAFDVATGTLVWTWWSMPADPDNPLKWDVGGGVWTGLSADADAIYVSTGSATECTSPEWYRDLNNPEPIEGTFEGVVHACDPPGDQYSIVKVDARTGVRLGSFRAPEARDGDPDFGSGTTIWDTTVDGRDAHLVGACNKDGWYYVVDSEPDEDGNLPLVWKSQVGSPTSTGEIACLSGAVYDRSEKRLFIAGNVIVKNADGSNTVTGRVRQVDPATGEAIWERDLPANALGAGTINANGVLAYAGMTWENQPDNGIYLLDSATGELLDADGQRDGANQLRDAGNATAECPDCTYDQFAQPVWGAGMLWMSNRTALIPWRVAPKS